MTSNHKVITSSRQVIGLLPYSIKRVILGRTFYFPLFISRRVLFFLTQPLASERRWIHKVIREDWKGVWITPHAKNATEAEKQATELDRIILYIHGGGFSLGYSTMYMSFFQQLIKSLHTQFKLSTAILSVEYSLCPEHRWPTACHECVNAYRYLVHEVGISPSKIVVIGDSAGGNLALTTLLSIRDLKRERQEKKEKDLPPLPLPSKVALLSPWVDLSLRQYPKRPDCILPDLIEMYVRNYVVDMTEASLKHPLVSPTYASLDQLDSTQWLICYGQHEILGPSIESFIDKVKGHKYDVTVSECDGEGHASFVHTMMSSSPVAYERDVRVLVNWISNL
ncbi:Esterase [Choanephora cucurbitarum]|uniref:Esterase n=1 Tax=Choanephora cucurbitarum TaxID=101091 RepID=A0A1C7N0Q2_9FUNG|nr:Esterase [Choanephora cucurbitarum]